MLNLVIAILIVLKGKVYTAFWKWLGINKYTLGKYIL